MRLEADPEAPVLRFSTDRWSSRLTIGIMATTIRFECIVVVGSGVILTVNHRTRIGNRHKGIVGV